MREGRGGEKRKKEKLEDEIEHCVGMRFISITAALIRYLNRAQESCLEGLV